jgi:Ni,Fe-hydrogenase maturation factor
LRRAGRPNDERYRRKFIEKINDLAQAPANLLSLRQRNHVLVVDTTQAGSQSASMRVIERKQ